MSDEDTVDAVARVLYRAHDDAMCLGNEPTHDYDVMAESDFHGKPVLEGWHAVARAAIKLGAHPRSSDPKRRFEELLGADSTNFLGSGLTLHDFMQLAKAEKLAASWSLQTREEQKRRLSAVIRLSAELERIREKEMFATGLAEMAIEAVIEGDWRLAASMVEGLTFKKESDELRSHAGDMYATFRELLLQACRADKDGPA